MKKGSLSDLGRKAIFFTLSSIMIGSLFMLYFSSEGYLTYREKAEMQQIRVTAVNNFANNFEKVYVPRAMFALTHKSIDSLIDFVVTKKTDDGIEFRIPNIEDALEKAIINGTINYGGVDILLPGMEDVNMTAWLEDLTTMSKEQMNIIIQYELSEITVKQEGPWAINITMLMTYNLTSPEVMGIWRPQVMVSTILSIEGLEDPLISIATNREVTRYINRSTVDIGAEGLSPSQRLETMKVILDNGMYIFQNKTGPSYLMRFEGNLSPSECCGIESLISEQMLIDLKDSDLDLDPFLDKSYTDHQYFTDYASWYIDTFPFFLGMCRDENKEAGVNLYNLTGISVYDDQNLDDPGTFPFRLDEFHVQRVFTQLDKDEMNVGCS